MSAKGENQRKREAEPARNRKGEKGGETNESANVKMTQKLVQ